MATFFIYTLAVVGFLALVLLAAAFLLAEPDEVEEVPDDFEVRNVEREIHDIARRSFERMLAEARVAGGKQVN